MEVSANINGYGDRLDSKKFEEIEHHGATLVLQEEHGEERHTREGAWLRRWKHFGVLGMMMLRFSRRCTDTVGISPRKTQHQHRTTSEVFPTSHEWHGMPLVRAREEVQYEVELMKLLSLLLDPVLTSDVGEVSSVSMNKLVLRRKLEKFWFRDNKKY